MALLSGLSYTPRQPEDALLRLSWRSPGRRVEECRRPTPEELERLPVHMRRDEICEGRIVPYRLRVTLDGRLEVDAEVHAAGAREDRPVYVFRELWMPPGRHALRISFRPVTGDEGGLSLDADVPLEPGTVRLVTRSDETGELEVR